VKAGFKMSLRNALLFGAVALTVTACGGDEPDPRYVGKFYSLTAFVDLDYVEDGKYLAEFHTYSDLSGWRNNGVFDAEIVNEKFYVDFGWQKDQWAVSDDGLLLTFVDTTIHEALRIPDDWDREIARDYMPNYPAWKQAKDDPSSWEAMLKDQAGVEIGL